MFSGQDKVLCCFYYCAICGQSCQSSIFTPFKISSSFIFFVNRGKNGTKCSIRPNKIWRSGEYRKQSRKKCSGDSDLKWQIHSGLSTSPIVNLCWFRSDRPTLILVKRVFPSFWAPRKVFISRWFKHFFSRILELLCSFGVVYYLVTYSRFLWYLGKRNC